MNATEKLTAARRCGPLALADEATLRWLTETAHTETYHPEQVVFDTGETSSRVYVVASGKLEVRLAPDAPLVGFFEPGALFGEYAMFVNGVRTARVTAATETTLLAIDAEDFRSFLLRSPESALELLRTAVRRLHRAERPRR